MVKVIDMSEKEALALDIDFDAVVKPSSVTQHVGVIKIGIQAWVLTKTGLRAPIKRNKNEPFVVSFADLAKK